MPYKKQNFQDGQVLKAEHLNTIEDGIVEVEEKADACITKDQGVENVGKILVVDEDGNAVPGNASDTIDSISNTEIDDIVGSIEPEIEEASEDAEVDS